jgi:hypothetical protein
MEGKTILNSRLFGGPLLLILPILTLAIMGLGGCWSSQEKVHKLFVVVAEVVEGDYQVESFLIDGKPPVEGMTRLPGEQVTVTVTFTRNWDVPDGRSVQAFLVRELKEGDLHRAGCHTTYHREDIASRPGRIKQTINTKIPLFNAENAAMAEKHGLGRYCKIIIAEARSEIVSHKIYLARE